MPQLLTPDEQTTLLHALTHGSSPQLVCDNLGIDVACYFHSLDEDDDFRFRLARTRRLMTENVTASLYQAAIKGKVGALSLWMRLFPPEPDQPAEPDDAISRLSDEEVELQLQAIRTADALYAAKAREAAEALPPPPAPEPEPAATLQPSPDPPPPPIPHLTTHDSPLTNSALPTPHSELPIPPSPDPPIPDSPATTTRRFASPHQHHSPPPPPTTTSPIARVSILS